ncbi:MAG TPA: hypothetical protein EYP56_04920 [Planctomycetaceae bacterium]|nr:hypothetical protein [Planctomycetaceae bacterium]
MKMVCHSASRPAGRPAYTLVEILTAITLTLMMMGAVVVLLGSVGETVNQSRELVETTDRLRAAQLRLQRDLGNVTATMLPPRPAGGSEGYLEYTEGPIGPVIIPELTDAANAVAINSDTGDIDTTVGDIDDMLMFTVRSEDRPFLGRVAIKVDPGPGQPPVGIDSRGPYALRFETIQSYEAEVAWFVRGRTLYRRMLLVLPAGVPVDMDQRSAASGIQTILNMDPRGFYNSDISVRLTQVGLIANTLADLTNPENRYAHRTLHRYGGNPPIRTGFPYHPHFTWDWTRNPPTLQPTAWSTYRLGLPTARETSYTNPTTPAQDWLAGGPLPQPTLTARGRFDAWLNPHPWQEMDPDTGTLKVASAGPAQPPPPYLGRRIGEDVILSNVVGFDVKAWDPGAPVVMDDTGTVALLPGDPGYLPALAANPSNATDQNNPLRYKRVSYGAYVDLNYMCLLGPENRPGPRGISPRYRQWILATGEPEPHFYHAGDQRSQLPGTPPYAKNFSDPTDWPPPAFRRAAVYDTWSTHYENNGINEDRVLDMASGQPPDLIDEGTNGFDDNGDGVVDDVEELETQPPYPVPLRGIQVKIRVFEPTSRQVREVTIVQDFLPK